MDIAQFHDLIDAHGPDLAAWPAAQRAAAEQLIAVDPAARASRAAALRLESLIARPAADESEAAAARVLAALGRSPLPRQRRPLRWQWPAALLDIDLAPAWPRVIALASVAALGIAIGLFGPDIRLDAGGAAASDLRSVAFDPEPLTGVGP